MCNVLQFILEIQNDLYIFKNKNEIKIKTRAIYAKFTRLNTNMMVDMIFYFDVFQQLIYFFFLLQALYTKRIRTIDALNFVTLIGVISEMMMSYIDLF